MTPLAYDFDMFSIMPDEVFADPKIRHMLKDAGITQRMAGNRIALFRDPRTVAALRAAPQSIRDWLRASGFGENVHPSTVPPGKYRASDEQDRLRIMNSLRVNAAKFPLPKAGSPEALASQFRIADFILGINSAEPMADAVLDAALAAAPRARASGPRTAKATPSASGHLRRRTVLVVAVAAAGVALSHFVADRMDTLTAASLATPAHTVPATAATGN